MQGVTVSGIKAAEQIQKWTGFTAPPWHKADARPFESTPQEAQTQPVRVDQPVPLLPLILLLILGNHLICLCFNLLFII